jgi:SAM-dependent methyltransferase
MKSQSYERIGKEYYDDNHSTCRNFEEATENFIVDHPHILEGVNTSGTLLDIGSGKGMAERYLGQIDGDIIQVDASPTMIEQASGLRVRADALALPFHNESFDTVSAFLYDPFNIGEFYQELARVLKPDGVFIGTLPNFQWASNFRFARDLGHGSINATYFTLEDGNRVEEASHVQVAHESRYTFWRYGFDKVETHLVPASYIKTGHSRSIADTAWSNNTRKPYEDLNVITIIKASQLDKSRAQLPNPPSYIRDIMTQIIASGDERV